MCDFSCKAMITAVIVSLVVTQLSAQSGTDTTSSPTNFESGSGQPTINPTEDGPRKGTINNSIQ